MLLFFRRVVLKEVPGGWSDAEPGWGNAAYAGGEVFKVFAETVLIAHDRKDHWEIESIQGIPPQGFPQKSVEAPGNLAERFGMVCGKRIH